MKETKNKKPNYQVNELIVIWVLISIMLFVCLLKTVFKSKKTWNSTLCIIIL